MSHDTVTFDLDLVQKRKDEYLRLFPMDKELELFSFNSKASAQSANLNGLAQFILDRKFLSNAYVYLYKPLMPEVVSRWISKLSNCTDTEAIAIIGQLARVITIFPLAMHQIESGFKLHSSKFDNLLGSQVNTEEEKKDVLLAYYRFLYQDKHAFSSYIKLDTMYNILSSETSSLLLKYITIKIISLLLDLNESGTLDMESTHIGGNNIIVGTYEGDHDVNYKFLELNEAKRFSNYSTMKAVESESTVTNYIKFDSSVLSLNVVSICGVLTPRISTRPDPIEYEKHYVPTEKTVTALQKLAGLLQKADPIMLLGKAGSGKTFLINELSKYMKCHDSIVKIHLGEQTDAKLLIGTYTSGETPGTFEWRSGVLSTAVKEGRWVLIEDIDKAPTEVLSVILSLLEKKELTIPSRGETIKAANGFQIIATIRTTDDKQQSDHSVNMIGMRAWNTIFLEEPSREELTQILCQKYHILSQLIPQLIQTYYHIQSIYADPRFVSLNKGAHSRGVSIRDLVKLCDRLMTLFITNNIKGPGHLIETSIFDDIFAETTDCFAGAVGEYRALEPLVRGIGEMLEIPESRIALYLTNRVPSFENQNSFIKVGRSTLEKNSLNMQKKSINSTVFATTNHSLRLMEQISMSIQMNEPLLLVGETGTGKTTVVQQVSKLLNKPLNVINVSQQTESGDLLGGYKPVNSKSIAIPIQEEFEMLFAASFSMKKNERFYKMLHKFFNRGNWKNVVKLWNEAFKMAVNILQPNENDDEKESQKKRRKLNTQERDVLYKKWSTFKESVDKFEMQSANLENSFVFNFVEGSLVKAVKNGEWLLLDEINLASADTLESISDLLSDPESRSILLTDRGDIVPLKVHPDFRLFACMNPATDVGKKDLPSGIRSRFTEIYVHSPDRDVSDLLAIIDKYIGKYSVSDEWIGNDIAELYMEAKRLSENNMIVDGSNQKPHFSIRTLTRTLLYVCDIIHIYGLRRSLYDGFCMSFLTLLDQRSEEILHPLIKKFTIGRLKNIKSVISEIPPSPGPEYIQFKHYWMKKGSDEPQPQEHYIITPFVEKNMMNLVRATLGQRFPVLIQGPTSAGKTSMIKYLADVTGHKFVRINNHEHTDLQEYLGTYITDDTGKLVFKEGVLVEALRNGYWIVLDELNLAPTDVLEALNRLLDDNRELFIPETQEVVHPHPDFMLFATQNPPGVYGGRKVLSRAFRNRFLELHFDDIPQDELEVILRERCKIAPSYAKKIVEVYRQLSIERSANRLFEQKNSFATLRDLFRWAMRDAVGYEELAANGYMLLAERCRNATEKVVIQKILERVMKVKLDMTSHYAKLEDKSLLSVETVVWTQALRRLVVLVSSAMKNKEPILLVGETGCGKTTVCQILATFLGKELIILNAHQNTETGDILGAQRPVRNRAGIQQQLKELLSKALDLPPIGSLEMSLEDMIKKYRESDDSKVESEMNTEIAELLRSSNLLFEWCDGPLIHAMKNESFFLLDEISLADDSVLERLNSVLEPERSLLLAEKGSSDSLVVAEPEFQFFATMNPGGDYGKKELSPALRNRFTEIWVPSMESFEDVKMIVENKLDIKSTDFPRIICDFSEWFGKKFGGGDVTNGIISLRDILAWVEFINESYKTINDPRPLLIHGAAMVFVDALGTNNTAYLAEDENILDSMKLECLNHLNKLSDHDLLSYVFDNITIDVNEKAINTGLFSLPRATGSPISTSFNFKAPTTARNTMKVIRAMQVHKPILLEGSPGVGKTSLISALASATGNKLTRINLSEQTDLVDLFGSDAPGENSGEFVWKDAPFLRAMQLGEWVLLDEMNLASQSVLEGLNACLDHRGEAYIPELDRSFTCHPNFCVFAAQNPQYQGGGRKGLPKSFVNRFSVVYVDMLKSSDLLLIARHLYPDIPEATVANIIRFISLLEEYVVKKKQWGTLGSPWEFNLRDTLRWLKLISSTNDTKQILSFTETIVTERFRTKSDRDNVNMLINEVFGTIPSESKLLQLSYDRLQINNEVILRNPTYRYPIMNKNVALQCNYGPYLSLMRCIKNSWPAILVGPSSSGKTELINYMAAVLGHQVNIFSMNSDIDSMDILGGYEQVDLNRKLSKVRDELLDILRVFVSSNLLNEKQNLTIMSNVILLYEKFNCMESFNNDSFKREYINAEKLLCSLGDNEYFTFFKETGTIVSQIGQKEPVKFEWFDGMLINAIEKGQWLVLDNANLCSPSVLDRLNSLLESESTLLINECSNEDGSTRTLTPHPDFRLFLTVDPKYGELSRAMRNRGIEIYLDSLSERSTVFDSKILKNHNAFPLKTFIPPFQSETLKYAELNDIILEDKLINEDVIISKIPVIDFHSIEYWQLNISNCSLFYNEKDIAHKTTQLVRLMSNTSIVRYHEEFLQLGQQLYLNPLINIYILPQLRENAIKISDVEILHLFSCLRLLSEMISSLDQLQRETTAAKTDEMNYLQLSAALFNGRYIKNPPSVPIFSILTKFQSYFISQFSNDCFIKPPAFYFKHVELLVILHSLINSCGKKEESKLRVYKNKIQDWMKYALEAQIEVDLLTEALYEFEDSLKLTRGLSMSQIWNKFRGKYPQSINAWKLWMEVETLIAKFDTLSLLQRSDSIASLSALHKTFFIVLDDICENNLDDAKELVQKLTLGINKLEAISDGFLIQKNSYFKKEFDDLLIFNAISPEKTPYQMDNVISLSSTPLIQLYKASSESLPYPNFLALLWSLSNNEVNSKTSTIFTSSFSESLLLKSSKLNEMVGSQIDETINDLQVLLNTTTSSSINIVQDPFDRTFKILFNWIVDVIYAHVELKERPSSVAELVAAIKENCNSHIIEVFQLYLFEKLLEYESNKTIELLGQCWIYFGITLVNLFCPNASYDPAIDDYVYYEIFSSHKKFFEALQKSWATYRMVTSGDNEIYIEQLVENIDPIPTPTKPQVFRGNEPVDDLFEEWNAFLTSSLSPEFVNDLVKGVSDNVSVTARIKSFQNNSSKFINRLETGSKMFGDLNEIFMGYIFAVKFGFDLLKQKQTDADLGTDISTLWAVKPLTITNDNDTDALFEKISAFIKRIGSNNKDAEVILLYCMKLFKFSKKNPRMVAVFHRVLYTLYTRWSLRKLREEKENENQTRSFKYTDETDNTEEEFKSMFPDYNELVEFGEEEKPQETLTDMYTRITNEYISLFEEDESINLQELIQEGNEVASLTDEISSFFKSTTISADILLSVINITSSKLQSFKSKTGNSNINIYKSYSIPESRKAAKLVTSLLYRINELLAQWPDHATLQDLYRISQEFLTFSLDTTIAKQLQKIEQLYTVINEWEKYASSNVSLSNYMTEVVQLLVSWRKMELQSWSGLLDEEDKKLESAVGTWWFYLYEVIILANTSENTEDENMNVTKLLQALNVFFSDSTIGEYKQRLKLVRAFRKHLAFALPEKEIILDALSNIIEYYSQFSEGIQDVIANSRKSLDKDMKEIILLASWKDVNIDALKQSSKRSHNNLYKIIRKYRSVITGKVTSIITGGLAYRKTKPLERKINLRDIELKINESFDSLLVNQGFWIERPSVLNNLEIVTHNMRNFNNKINAWEFPSFTDLSEEYMVEAERLKKETPSVYSKSVKKQIATLKVQKRKLLSDGLKELRRIGLKTNFRADIQKVQSSSTAILANSPAFSAPIIFNSDKQFYLLVDLLPRLRSAVSEPQDDVPVNSIEKGMAVAENLIFSLIVTRKPIVSIADRYHKMENILEFLMNIQEGTAQLSLSACQDILPPYQRHCTKILELVNFSLSTVEQCSDSSLTSKSIKKLEKIKSRFMDMEAKIQSCSIFKLEFGKLHTEYKENIQNTFDDLSVERASNTSFLFTPIEDYLGRMDIDNYNNNEADLTNIEAISRSLTKILSSILIHFQKIMSFDLSDITEEDDKWLSKLSKQLMKVINIINTDHITKALDILMKKIVSLNYDTTMSTILKAILNRSVPVLQGYMNMVTILISKCKSFYSELSTGTYSFSTILLNLAKNGFCSPEPPTEEKEDNNLHEGTGLGDGEGAQNNSKDIDQDEDLTEDAQTENKDQKDKDERDEDEEDNAVDMEGDMAGELEELSEENNTSDEDNDQEDDEDMDEEIDNLDDDSNAIDDKMWDEKADDSLKEKETDNQVNNNDEESADVEAAENDANNGENESKEETSKEENQDSQENQENQEVSDGENSESGEEEDVGEQEDEVRNDSHDDDEFNAPEIETMDLPEDMKLDSDEDIGSQDENENLDEESDNEVSDVEEQNPASLEQMEVEEEEILEEDNNDGETENNETDDMDVDEDKDGDREEENNNEEGGAEEQNSENEEELLDDQAQQEKSEMGGEMDTENADGAENFLENEADINEASTAQNSGSKGTGADTKDEEEQDDIGSSGLTSNDHKEEESEMHDDNSRKEADDILKELGDSLKEYHNRRQEINKASMDEHKESEQSANQRPDEFEHIDGDNTESNTQALGSANQEEIQKLNEEMAIEDDNEGENGQDDEEEGQQGVEEAIDTEIKEEDMEEKNEGENENSNSRGAFASTMKDLTLEDNSLFDSDGIFKKENYENELDEIVENIDKESHLRAEMDEPHRPVEEARMLWTKSEKETTELSARLGEQLRLILEPTLATKLRGDYKTGKRLNMKRIIPYIASQFRKDKIWLRRTKPSKREYQIMLALDNSKSMSESKSVQLAFNSLCLVSKTLSQLESGGLSIVRFGEYTKEVHSFDQSFSNDSGSKVFQWFDFQETKTDVKRLVAESIKIFERARSFSANDQWQLEIVISDGICEDHDTVEKLVRRARDKKIMLVFVIIDGLGNSNESIMDMSQVKYIPDGSGNPQLKITKYLDTFPFEFYVVVHDIAELPEMLSLILRQYFSDLAST
ncbi:Midasin [Nakaseomyces bracarensis]|uniref:Midasin n=1 Tax=Nakaseomyces bracarensis TaxID=273131 RepID=A0ABR4NM09_9SACH